MAEDKNTLKLIKAEKYLNEKEVSAYSSSVKNKKYQIKDMADVNGAEDEIKQIIKSLISAELPKREDLAKNFLISDAKNDVLEALDIFLGKSTVITPFFNVAEMNLSPGDPGGWGKFSEDKIYRTSAGSSPTPDIKGATLTDALEKIIDAKSAGIENKIIDVELKIVAGGTISITSEGASKELAEALKQQFPTDDLSTAMKKALMQETDVKVIKDRYEIAYKKIRNLITGKPIISKIETPGKKHAVTSAHAVAISQQVTSRVSSKLKNLSGDALITQELIDAYDSFAAYSANSEEQNQDLMFSDIYTSTKGFIPYKKEGDINWTYSTVHSAVQNNQVPDAEMLLSFLVDPGARQDVVELFAKNNGNINTYVEYAKENKDTSNVRGRIKNLKELRSLFFNSGTIMNERTNMQISDFCASLRTVKEEELNLSEAATDEEKKTITNNINQGWENLGNSYPQLMNILEIYFKNLGELGPIGGEKTKNPKQKFAYASAGNKKIETDIKSFAELLCSTTEEAVEHYLAYADMTFYTNLSFEAFKNAVENDFIKYNFTIVKDKDGNIEYRNTWKMNFSNLPLIYGAIFKIRNVDYMMDLMGTPQNTAVSIGELLRNAPAMVKKSDGEVEFTIIK